MKTYRSTRPYVKGISPSRGISTDVGRPGGRAALQARGQIVVLPLGVALGACAGPVIAPFAVVGWIGIAINGSDTGVAAVILLGSVSCCFSGRHYFLGIFAQFIKGKLACLRHLHRPANRAGKIVK